MATITSRLQKLLKQTEKMKKQATRGLLKTLKQIDHERKKRTADLDDAARLIGKQLSELGHTLTGTTARKPVAAKMKAALPGAKKKRRIRRSPEQLQKYASDIFQFVKANSGSKGGAIRKAFPDVGQDIAGFVAKHTDKKLGTKGKRATMTYHV
jgi:hypothetical protein